MKDYEAYLFDWDGTIGKTLELWIEVLRNQFEKLGRRDISDEQIVSTIGRWVEIPREFSLTSAQFDAFNTNVQAEFREKLINVALYRGITECLERLGNHSKKLALITSNWRAAVNDMLRHHSLENTFDLIITIEDVKAHKPDPEGIEMALKKLGVGKDKAVMLGDSEKDLGAAKNAGIDSILFYPPDHQLFYELDFLKGHEPTHIIDSWDSVLSEPTL